jgi:K+-sensing histidine kinase KdpD
MSHEAIARRLAGLEAEHAKCEARIRELSEQNTNLVQLTVASQLLTTSFDREDVLRAIEEIVVNMVGSEEIAIFELAPDGRSLALAYSRGIDTGSPHLELALRPLQTVMSSGSILVLRDRHVRAIDGDDGEDGGLTAAIPLKVEANVMGVVAIFRLLQQKQALDPIDHELFDIVSRQAALALYSAAFRSLKPTVRPPQTKNGG